MPDPVQLPEDAFKHPEFIPTEREKQINAAIHLLKRPGIPADEAYKAQEGLLAVIESSTPKPIVADNQGLRYDDGKLEYHLMPTDGLQELAKVFTRGARKYEPYNWERGMKWTKVYNSLRRHLDAFWEGEQLDPETGLHHMAHATWNALALLVYSLRGIGTDDRRCTVVKK